MKNRYLYVSSFLFFTVIISAFFGYKTNNAEAKASNRTSYVYVLLMNNDEACSASTYTALATKLPSGKSSAKSKNLGNYVLINQLMTQANASTLNVETDTCLEMLFRKNDRKSLRKMRNLLKTDMQTNMQTNGFDQLVNDLPTNCEDLKEVLTKKLSSSRVDKIYKKCLAIQEKRSQYEDSEDQGGASYESDEEACMDIDPNIDRCTPALSESQYVQFAMDYITPDDSTVKSFVSGYTDLEKLYETWQTSPWQSDDTLFNCGDYFQKPSYYLNTSPTINSNMTCGDKAGDCDDKGNSFASAIIASGLYDESEVRVALGYVNFGGSYGGHLWTEVLMDGKWTPVDATTGSYCDDKGNCEIYTAKELSSWGYNSDYYKYVEYPVIDYWGVANNLYYCTEDNGWKCSSTTPSNWATGAKTIYDN